MNLKSALMVVVFSLFSMQSLAKISSEELEELEKLEAVFLSVKESVFSHYDDVSIKTIESVNSIFQQLGKILEKEFNVFLKYPYHLKKFSRDKKQIQSQVDTMSRLELRRSDTLDILKRYRLNHSNFRGYLYSLCAHTENRFAILKELNT